MEISKRTLKYHEIPQDCYDADVRIVEAYHYSATYVLIFSLAVVGGVLTLLQFSQFTPAQAR